ncbi:MAG: hypothetical protein IJS15_16475 [Victivallales bacterium]|nr:hypothetical protein [Victivallales bacterium]
MENESLKFNGKQPHGKMPYEPPSIKGIDQAFGLIAMGDSNIIDDEDHEYDPDNDD